MEQREDDDLSPSTPTSLLLDISFQTSATTSPASSMSVTSQISLDLGESILSRAQSLLDEDLQHPSTPSFDLSSTSLVENEEAQLAATTVHHDEYVQTHGTGPPLEESNRKRPRTTRHAVESSEGKAVDLITSKRSAWPLHMNEQINHEELANFDTLAQVQQVSHLGDHATFEGVTDRRHALKQMRPPADGADRRQIYADLKALDKACQIFGRRQIAPRDGNMWQPRGMKASLKPHQVLGTAFMLKREISGHKGGILADHMGLGKTIMTLALITNVQDRKPKETLPTLIIVKKSLLRQWHQEIMDHCEQRSETKTKRGVGLCDIYSESHYRESLSPLEVIASHHIILTTYAEVCKSYPLKTSTKIPREVDKQQAWWEENYEQKKGILHKVHFHRVVLDEAHELRNPNSKTFRAVLALSTQHCWCLTGTVAINGLYDIWGLLKLVGVDPGMPYNRFRTIYSGKTDENAISKYEELLEECVLRRTLAHTLLGGKMLTLPPTSGIKLKVYFNAVEHAIYEVFRKRFRAILVEMPDELQGRYRVHAWGLLCRLRQLTAHPLVIHSTLTDILNIEDLKSLLQVATDTLNTIDREGRTTMSLLVDMLSHQLHARTDGSRIIMDGPTQDQIGGLGSDEDAGPKTTTNMIQLGHNYGQRHRFKSYIEKTIAVKRGLGVPCVYCKEVAEDAYLTSCQHVYCAECLHDSLTCAGEVGQDVALCAECGTAFDTAVPMDSDAVMADQSRKQKRAAPMKPLEIDIRQAFGEDPLFIPSAKSTAVKAAIMTYLREEPDCKIVVFSQWLMMLRLLQEMCKCERWGARLYHGSMSAKARVSTLDEFRANPSIKVLLCSLKTGGLGLNLTAASRIICVDPWFNNATENQAFARVYRIGQTKETSMLTLTAAGTVDELLEEIKDHKQNLIDHVESVEGLQGSLTKQDYLTILGTAPEVVPDDQHAHAGAAGDTSWGWI